MPAEERRAQLLDAAIAIIVRDGYGGVSIDGIAREAGVSRTVVYGVFESLDELLYALLDRQEERAFRQLISALPGVGLGGAPGGGPDGAAGAGLPGTAVEVIVGVIRQWAAAVVSEPLTWRPILLAPGANPPAARRRIDQDREVLRERIRDLLALAAPGVDADFAAHAAIGLAEYFGRLLVADPPAIEVEALVGAARSLLEPLLRPVG